MIKYPIGIDLGENHLSAAQLQRQGKGLAIRGLYHRELQAAAADAGEAAEAAIKESLLELVRSKQFAGRSVVLNVPSKNLSIFPMTVQVGKEETLEEAILREAEKYLPFPLEEAVLDYPCLIPDAGAPDRYKVTITAIRQSTINSYISLLQQAGFVVEAVDFAVSSLLRLHRYVFKATPNPIILCHIGHTKTLLAAVNEDGILVQSDVTWGARGLISRILADIGLSHDPESARVLLKKYGLVFDARQAEPEKEAAPADDDMSDVSRTIFQIITPYIDEIIYELHKVISYVHSEKQNFVIDGLFLYGQAAGISNLDHYLENRLDIATTTVDPLTNLAADRHNAELQAAGGGMFALALGLALRRMPWL